MNIIGFGSASVFSLDKILDYFQLNLQKYFPTDQHITNLYLFYNGQSQFLNLL